jgi:hypothetical protein
LTEAELAELDAQIEGSGLNRNRALRIAARRIGGFLEVDAAMVEELRGINRQLAGVATNINQIAHAANRFVAEHNQSPKPFVWRADPDAIIAARARGFQALESNH